MGAIVPDTVEQYLASLTPAPPIDGADDPLQTIFDEGREEGLPLVDPAVGTLLQLLTRAIGATQVLEIGTAIGYSGSWIARALPPSGRLFTFEVDAARATRAKANFARVGVGDRAHVMVGDAHVLISKVRGPFDLVFQDGDKEQYEAMLDPLVERLRPGGLLVTDNVLWGGAVVPGFDPPSPRSERRERSAEAIAAYNRRLAADSRILTSWLPLRDGVALSVKR